MKRAISLVLLAAITSARADAPDAQTRANELFSRAQVRYEAGDYRQAIALFDEAYQLVRDPVYLFNSAQAYRKVLDCVPAAKYFERYLAEATDADVAQRSKVKELIAELGPCIADRAAAKPVVVESAPKPVSSAVTAPPPGRGQRVGGLALVGVGAVGLVVGAIYTAKGTSIEGDLAECAAGCQWTAEREALDRDGSRANKISLVSFIAGGAAVGGGAILYMLGRSKRNERRVAFAPLVTRGNAAVFASFPF